jgi:membrane-associated HD superfamily phosphohydrolase
LIFLLFSGFVFFALLIPLIGNLSAPPLIVGDVAPYDIHAPNGMTFTSQILTARQQDAAADGVQPVYSSVDTNIARQQLERLRNTLIYINSVRADTHASLDQKTNDLVAIDGIQLNHDIIRGILNLSEPTWQNISQESTLILDQLMREPIREDNLTGVTDKVPSLVSLSFTDDQSAIITALVQAHVSRTACITSS